MTVGREDPPSSVFPNETVSAPNSYGVTKWDRVWLGDEGGGSDFTQGDVIRE